MQVRATEPAKASERESRAGATGPARPGPAQIDLSNRWKIPRPAFRSILGRRGGSIIQGMAVIEVSGLRKTYDGRVVVADLDLEVDFGECFALLGPNGAGKTTTVEILEGFRSRDSGVVNVLGQDPAAGNRAWRARIGVVGQTTGAALDLSVVETLRHFAVYHSHPHGLDALLDAVGLTEQADIRIASLSGGQRRRLDVALGVQGRPELLFLDEPTTGMDPQARRQFWTLIEELRGSGTTILLTTHYLDEAARLASRVAVVANGRLLDVAPPDDLGGELRAGATVRWRTGGALVEIATATPTQLVRELLAEQPHGEIADLSIVRPTLEDAYLALLDRAELNSDTPDSQAADPLATSDATARRNGS